LISKSINFIFLMVYFSFLFLSGLLITGAVILSKGVLRQFFIFDSIYKRDVVVRRR